jgi:hypothetical protein
MTKLHLLGCGLVAVLFVSSCQGFVGGNGQSLETAAEVQLEVAWQIPMESPGQGLNALFSGDYMYFVNVPKMSLVTIDLRSHEIVNNIAVESLGTEPVRCGDTIYCPNSTSDNNPPVIRMFNLDGSLKGLIAIDKAYTGWAFDFYVNDNYLYWDAFDGKDQSFVCLDTKTIAATGEGKYTATVETLYPTSKGYEVLATPAFIGGKIYLPVNPKDSYEGSGDKTRLLVFDEASGALEEESDLDGFFPLGTGITTHVSGTTALIDNVKIDLSTKKILSRGVLADGLFAPATIIGNDYYASSMAHGGTDFVSLWKLDLSSLEVKWHYQHRYSLGSQPQVANGIVFVTGPDVTMLFDADTGKLLAKDSNLKGHPIQQANSTLYNGLMIFHDGYHITAIKTNWRKNWLGQAEKF